MLLVCGSDFVGACADIVRGLCFRCMYMACDGMREKVSTILCMYVVRYSIRSSKREAGMIAL